VAGEEKARDSPPRSEAVAAEALVGIGKTKESEPKGSAIGTLLVAGDLLNDIEDVSKMSDATGGAVGSTLVLLLRLPNPSNTLSCDSDTGGTEEVSQS